MNLSYFRKSGQSVEETVSKLEKLAKEMGWKVVGSDDLPDGESKLVFISRPEWVEKALKISISAISVFPAVVLVKKDNEKTVIGMGNPAVMGNAFGNQELAKESLVMEREVRQLIDGAAGVGPLKPVRTVVYSTTTCPYCKMEKEYFDEKGIKYENIMVDINQEAAKEMVKRTGQMGVPVTQIEYDDAEPEYVVGFDKERLNKLLEIK